jgi:hypothetical protein
MMRLRIGKFCGKRAHGKFRHQGAPEGENLVGEPAVFAGIVNVDAGAEDGGCLCLGGQGAAVRGRVYAAGHATNNDDPTGRKVASKPLGHAQPIGSRMPGADDSNAGNGEHSRIAADVQRHRRIVDLLQQRRIRGIIQREDLRSYAGRAHHLLLRQLRRLAQRDRLRCGNVQPGGFQFGQIRGEHRIRAAEVLHQPAASARAEGRYEGEGEPVKLLRGGSEVGSGHGESLSWSVDQFVSHSKPEENLVPVQQF